jgi:hypothetical protein
LGTGKTPDVYLSGLPVRNLKNTRCLNILTHIPFSMINQKHSLFPETVSPPFVPGSGAQGYPRFMPVIADF